MELATMALNAVLQDDWVCLGHLDSLINPTIALLLENNV